MIPVIVIIFIIPYKAFISAAAFIAIEKFLSREKIPSGYETVPELNLFIKLRDYLRMAVSYVSASFFLS